MHSEQEIYDQIRQVLIDLFEIEESAISMEAHLTDDLDIDSIDAIDLLAELKGFTKNKVDPDDFKAVTTLGDVVAVVKKMDEQSTT